MSWCAFKNRLSINLYTHSSIWWCASAPEWNLFWITSLDHSFLDPVLVIFVCMFHVYKNNNINLSFVCRIIIYILIKYLCNIKVYFIIKPFASFTSPCWSRVWMIYILFTASPQLSSMIKSWFNFCCFNIILSFVYYNSIYYWWCWSLVRSAIEY